MTESAYRDIELATAAEVRQGEEWYEGFGSIRTYTVLTGNATARRAEGVEQLYADRGRAFATGLRMLAKGYFGQLGILLRGKPGGTYRNLGELPARPLVHAIMALRVILLAPVVIPLGAGVQAYRALTRSTLSDRRRRA
jgi:hypothetical protein